MTIKYKLARLEKLSRPDEPYKIQSPYLTRLCAELGMEPMLHPIKPKHYYAYLRQLQQAIAGK